MTKNEISIFSLTTSYVRSDNLKRSQFVHVLNKELVKNGIKITTITLHQKGSFRNEVRDGVKIRRFRYLPERLQLNETSIPEASKTLSGKFKIVMISTTFFIFTFFKCLKEKPDILHGHWAYPGGFIAFLISKIFRKKFIVTIHGSDLALLNKFGMIRKLVVFSMNKSHMVIANSSYAKDELIKMGVFDEKICIIRVPPDFVEPETDEKVLEKFKKNFTDLSSSIVLFVGRLVEVKGIEYLIKTFSEMKNPKIHLIIVGDGPLEVQLKNLTKSLELERKITFFGNANSKELGLLHGIGDVLVCPSIIYSRGATEGLPMVIPEAMKSGLPVIGSSVGGITDVIKNKVNGLLVEEKNPKALANAIERIISDEELRKKIIENSQETVKEFSPRTIGEKYCELYKNCLN